MKIQNLDTIDKPIFVFGGPYSNYEALQSVRSIAEGRGFRPKEIICTGDIVAYCSKPLESIKFIQEWGIHVIAGNVELNLRDEADDCGCNFNEGSRCDIFSRQWFPYAKSSMTEESLRYIHTLPEFIQFDFYGHKTTVLHGSWHNTSEFIYQSTDDSIKNNNFTDTNSALIIAGHCGIPFRQNLNGKHWINPGVIGMPANDGTTRTWCAIISHNTGEIHTEFIPVEYDFNAEAKEMEVNKLPMSYANTLKTGIWDNCEILPKKETDLQGIALEF